MRSHRVGAGPGSFSEASPANGTYWRRHEGGGHRHRRVAPGATTGRHTHPGDEYTLVLEGTLELRLEGREPRRVNAGDAYHNPKGVIHETRNVGDGPARASATFVIDKGKPISLPAQ